ALGAVLLLAFDTGIGVLRFDLRTACATRTAATSGGCRSGRRIGLFARGIATRDQCENRDRDKTSGGHWPLLFAATTPPATARDCCSAEPIARSRVPNWGTAHLVWGSQP